MQPSKVQKKKAKKGRSNKPAPWAGKPVFKITPTESQNSSQYILQRWSLDKDSLNLLPKKQSRKTLQARSPPRTPPTISIDLAQLNVELEGIRPRSSSSSWSTWSQSSTRDHSQEAQRYEAYGDLTHPLATRNGTYQGVTTILSNDLNLDVQASMEDHGFPGIHNPNQGPGMHTHLSPNTVSQPSGFPPFPPHAYGLSAPSSSLEQTMPYYGVNNFSQSTQHCILPFPGEESQSLGLSAFHSTSSAGPTGQELYPTSPGILLPHMSLDMYSETIPYNSQFPNTQSDYLCNMY